MGLERKRLFNLIFALTDRLGRSPRLSLSDLLDTVRRKTALDDYGDRSFLEPLEVLLSEFRESSQLTPLGRRCVQATILEKLANRLFLQQFRRAHPELETKAVRRPLLVTGHRYSLEEFGLDERALRREWRAYDEFRAGLNRMQKN